MKYIFCNSRIPVDVELYKRDDVIHFRGAASEITDYYCNNTVIVIPYKDTTKSDIFNKRKDLNKIISENKMNLEEIGTSVWVPIDENKNFGIIYTSTENTYWAFVSIMGLIDKFTFKIDTVIFDAEDFYVFKFEDQINKAMIAQKKLDFAPEINNIYFNP